MKIRNKSSFSKKKKVPVTGDWINPYDGNLVEVSLHCDSANLFRVAVWGEGGYGLEKEFTSAMEAKEQFKEMNSCSKEQLISNGFIRA